MTLERSAGVLWAVTFFAIGPVAALAPRSLVTILLGSCALALILHLYHRRRLPWPAWRTAVPISLFVIYAGVSASWSLVPHLAASQFIKFLYLFGPALLLSAILAQAPDRERYTASRALLAGALLGAALVLLDTITGHPMLGAIHGTDSAGNVGDPAANRSVVAVATIVWPAALALAATAGGLWPVALPIGYLAVSALTTSQSAAFGLFAGLVAYLIAAISVRAARYLAIAAVLIGFCGSAPLASLAYSTGLSDANWLQYSARHRLEVWNFAAERIARQPIFGFGLDSSRAMPNEGNVSKFESWTDKVIPLHTHNFFLQIWLELGAIGAALAFAALVALLRATRGADDASQRFILAAFMCNLAIATVTSFSMWQTWWTSALILSALSILPSARLAPSAHDSRAAP